jgi:chromosomal replication initiator protein
MNVDEGRTLRNFIVGASNRKAIERIQQSFRTRRALPPILLLGPSGVGKSHLLQAVANRLGARGKRVLAVRAHEFRERYIADIHAGATAEFRSRLRTHDALVIDELDDLTRYDVVFDELSRFVRELVDAGHPVYFSSVKRWPALFDELARWNAAALR